ncbi:hypothetical protein GCM10017771_94420 [Streptomyces capitiformicae]|uniref:Uncharacterized protein n=1 Tax=Streptomyces capitiformicae TaxID=2014920 RepID=A0A918ZUB1_9ACTN|nr:hypothetical protein GCM10017771_94420 [Streptomyces capitiformicae]
MFTAEMVRAGARVPAAQTDSALVLFHLRIQPLQDRPVARSAKGPSDDLVRDEVELDVEVLGDRAQHLPPFLGRQPVHCDQDAQSLIDRGM